MNNYLNNSLALLSSCLYPLVLYSPGFFVGICFFFLPLKCSPVPFRFRVLFFLMENIKLKYMFNGHGFCCVRLIILKILYAHKKKKKKKIFDIKLYANLCRRVFKVIYVHR